MKRTQRNYFNMAQAVCDVFATNTGWQTYAVIGQSLQKVKDLCGDINKTAMHQQQNRSNGHTTTTDLARTHLEDHLYTTSMRVQAWAEAAGNMVVLNGVKLSRSALRKMPLQTMLTHARAVADTCQQNVAALSSYHVFQADIDSLLAEADKVGQLNGHRDAVVDSRMENTSQLKQSFASLRDDLNALDTLMEAYITDRTLLAVYFNARRIHDVKGGSSNAGEEMKPAA